MMLYEDATRKTASVEFKLERLMPHSHRRRDTTWQTVLSRRVVSVNLILDDWKPPPACSRRYRLPIPAR